ncbi:MAG TPA: bifunctional phosphopantothenoylcysteine decarboxylase/phosphopantothenate--cysteine ligase CoaBC [Acidimicrobiales bacterium]|nr:bifunctional phosphopantothenoylcysteine decarboxylase/phosphopantothenate--cysteine ligase CoaBC [Acidimicrobiales bacterium]
MSGSPDERNEPPLAGRRVVLGVCGGIAAYKAVEVCRRLVDAGAFVSPVLTEGSTRFVGAVTFSALGSEPARTSLFDDADPIPHTTLGRAADVVVVAPATARLLGAYAAGISDDLLTATLLATRAPVIVCPAMHTEMWEHPATKDNVATLVRRGVHVVPPATGALAGGDSGTGRLAEPDEIVLAVSALLAAARPPRQPGDLAGRHVLVTAGGTREPIDAVRFIGNRSSGRQGHALADEAVGRGAVVTLVTTADRPTAPGVTVVRVDTAAEMERAVLAYAPEADVVVMAAAVADFRPKVALEHKWKKADGVPEVVLEPTPDILASLGARRRPGQVLVGFAAETSSVVAGARAKLRGKHLDLVVANDVTVAGAGFDARTNAVVLVGADGTEQTVALTDKREVARFVFDAVVPLMRSTP